MLIQCICIKYIIFWFFVLVLTVSCLLTIQSDTSGDIAIIGYTKNLNKVMKPMMVS